MFGTKLGHTRERVVAVADISGGGSALAVLSLEKGKPARVVCAERSPLSFTADSPGSLASVTQVSDRFQKSYQTYVAKGGEPAGELFVVLHTPLSRSRIGRVTEKFATDTLITDRTIVDMAAKMLSEQHNLDKQNLFEASVIRTELNGYPTSVPIRKHVRQITVSALLSECTNGIRPAIDSSLSISFPHITPVYRSATRAMITVLNKVLSDETNYLVVDVASEGTMLSAVRGGVLDVSASVEEGTRSIVKRVSGAGLPEESLSLIRMLANDSCSDPACDTIRASMARAEQDLVRSFGEAMSKCAETRRLPDTLFLIAHPDIAWWLAKFFSRIDFGQFTLTTQPFDVRAVEPKDLAPFVEFPTNSSFDASLGLASALVDIEKRTP